VKEREVHKLSFAKVSAVDSVSVAQLAGVAATGPCCECTVCVSECVC
jgi:hypothetical protein